jgi:hypothetical protein
MGESELMRVESISIAARSEIGFSTRKEAMAACSRLRLPFGISRIDAYFSNLIWIPEASCALTNL